MYKRYVAGQGEKAGTLGNIVVFFVFGMLVVWCVPLAVQAVSEMPMDIFMVPPIWRGDIMCPEPSEGTQYSYRDGMCYVQCIVPGGANCNGIVPPLGEEQWRANLAKSRESLGLYDIYSVGLMGLKYGTVVGALASAAVMYVGRPAWVWCMIPCGIGATVCAMYDGIWPVGIAAMIVAYAADVYSTARFGRRLMLYETNVIMRYMFRRYTVRLALTLHTIWYFAAIVGVSVLLGSTGPIQWHVMLGSFMFGLAACHIWCAAGNVKQYRLEELA